MSNASVTIPESVLAQAIQKSVLEGIPATDRDAILAKAIEHLMTLPPVRKSDYGWYREIQDPSPLQDAFNRAAHQLAVKEIEETLADPAHPYRVQLRNAIGAAVEKLFASGDADAALGDAIAEGLRKALSKR